MCTETFCISNLPCPETLWCFCRSILSSWGTLGKECSFTYTATPILDPRLHKLRHKIPWERGESELEASVRNYTLRGCPGNHLTTLSPEVSLIPEYCELFHDFGNIWLNKYSPCKTCIVPVSGVNIVVSISDTEYLGSITLTKHNEKYIWIIKKSGLLWQNIRTSNSLDCYTYS